MEPENDEAKMQQTLYYSKSKPKFEHYPHISNWNKLKQQQPFPTSNNNDPDLSFINQRNQIQEYPQTDISINSNNNSIDFGNDCNDDLYNDHVVESFFESHQLIPQFPRKNNDQLNVSYNNNLVISQKELEGNLSSTSFYSMSLNISEVDILEESFDLSSAFTNVLQSLKPYEFKYVINDVNSIIPPFHTPELTGFNPELVLHFLIKNNSNQIWGKWDIKRCGGALSPFDLTLSKNVDIGDSCEFKLKFDIRLNSKLTLKDYILRDEINYLIFGFYNQIKRKMEIVFKIGFTIE